MRSIENSGSRAGSRLSRTALRAVPALALVAVCTLGIAAPANAVPASGNAQPTASVHPAKGPSKPGGTTTTSAVKASLFATNSDAKAVPSWVGTQSTFHSGIHDLAVADGKVFAGYGDYNINTGPVSLNSYSIATGAEKHEVMGMPAEEIHALRVWDGKVYAPNMDPRVSWTSPANYGLYDSATHAGSYVANTPFVHVFDAAKLGGELFLAGSIQNPDKTAYGPTNTIAAIKKSVDGGATWTIERTAADDPAVLATYPGDGEYARYYWMSVVNGKLYTRASTMSATGAASLAFQYPGKDGVQHTAYNNTGLDVYTPGSGWSTVDPGPVIATLPHPYHADAVGSKIVFSKSTLRGDVISVNGSAGLAAFDTATGKYTTISGPGLSAVLDTYQDGSTTYMLANSPTVPAVYSSTDGSTWTKRADVSGITGNAESIAVSGSTVFIGTGTATIYKATLPN